MYAAHNPATKIAAQQFAQNGTISLTVENGRPVRVHGIVFTNDHASVANLIIFTASDSEGNIIHKCTVKGLSSAMMDTQFIANKGITISVLDNGAANTAGAAVYYSTIGD